MKVPKNPELSPLRVYVEDGMAIVCVKRLPSMVLELEELAQVQYLLSLSPKVIDAASYLVRELGPENASNRLKVASEKVGLG